MDKYEFWDIIRRFTTTIFCTYTPNNIDVELKKEKSKINIEEKSKNTRTEEDIYIIENFV